MPPARSEAPSTTHVRARTQTLRAATAQVYHRQATPRGTQVRSPAPLDPRHFGAQLDSKRRAHGTRPCAVSITGAAQAKSTKASEENVRKIWGGFIGWFFTGYWSDDGKELYGGFKIEALDELSEDHSCDKRVWEGFATYLYSGYLSTRTRDALGSQEKEQTHLSGSTAVAYFGYAFQASLRRCAPSTVAHGSRVCSRANTYTPRRCTCVRPEKYL
jgi:hypothetical protein